MFDIERGLNLPEIVKPKIFASEAAPTDQSIFRDFWRHQGTWNPVVHIEIDWCDPLDPIYRATP